MPLKDWTGFRVRRKNDPKGAIGTVQGRGNFSTWWKVEWPDGKTTQDPQRLLVVVPEDEFERWLAGQPRR